MRSQNRRHCGEENSNQDHDSSKPNTESEVRREWKSATRELIGYQLVKQPGFVMPVERRRVGGHERAEPQSFGNLKICVLLLSDQCVQGREVNHHFAGSVGLGDLKVGW